MARIILQGDGVSLHASKTSTTTSSSTLQVDITKRRSKKYLELFASLDHHSLTNTRGMAELLAAVQEEFGAADLTSLPLGIVSKCFLGAPYEVHTLDLAGGQIIHHYKVAEAMPGNFEKARTLARHNAYVFVEVYSDKLVLIREDGSATKV